jgi:hypothetical protein
MLNMGRFDCKFHMNIKFSTTGGTNIEWKIHVINSFYAFSKKKSLSHVKWSERKVNEVIIQIPLNGIYTLVITNHPWYRLCYVT